ncbi:MAG: methionyl-tRNA formyltransferase [Ginsengibacter sp.]
MNNLRIIFMGTPEFAVPSLEKLLEAGFEVAGVITAPDKPAGRGLQLTESAVKKYAFSKELKILQPEKLKNPAFIDELKALHADLQVVVAFRMLPEIVWNMPPMGTINVHASLLPQYRGAAPINWAIINGEIETGITTFKLKHEVDTGNILLQEKIKIGDTETAGELHDRLKTAGAEVLIKTIKRLLNNELDETSQSINSGNFVQAGYLQHAPKLTNENCKIKWEKSTDAVYNLIRGLSPLPAAFTFLNGKTLKIYAAEKETTPVIESAGTIHTDHKTFLKFACANGYIRVKELQLEGKKKMKVEDFLRGWRR